MKDFFRSNGKKIFFASSALSASLFFVSALAFYQSQEKPELMVSFFDVGQGDSIFIESYDGTQILIDGGPPNRILPLLGERMPYFDKYIDVVVLTHPHADHVSGLIEVLEKYDVGMLIESGADYHTAEAKIFEKMVKEKNIKKIIIERPVGLNFYNNAVLRFIYPEESFLGKTLKNVHDSALISELDFNGKKILFMSDAEKNIEKRLADEGKIGDVDVLKTGHHGSKTSSNDFFLAAAKPEYAVISVGARNRYGHPHQQTLSNLEAIGAKIFRTDLDGTITLEIRNGDLVWK
ncbi:MAG: MBL fold metallo-hydrolase [Candidatus Giovannonibacteria bacterium]|nr:MAG: MBL fold metallo-hydrolase [Candidatus Giovannonibacteria bacterium]